MSFTLKNHSALKGITGNATIKLWNVVVRQKHDEALHQALICLLVSTCSSFSISTIETHSTYCFYSDNNM